jgi:uncharacterized protein with HEPN domain
VLRKIRKHLLDIKQATDLLAEVIQNKTFSDYEQEPMLSATIECEIEVIGQALNRLGKLNQNTVQRITDSQQIISLRKSLIQGSADVDNEHVWDVVTNKLTTLRQEVDLLLKENRLMRGHTGTINIVK